jgi:predicted outer membrane repeat protein
MNRLRSTSVKHLLIRLLTCSCLLAAPAARARTIVVSPNQPGGIQGAIDTASPGDTVRALSGYYYERLTLRNGVSVVAQAIGTVYVLAESEGPVLTAVGIGSTTTVRGLVLGEGGAYAGGGLYAVASSLRILYCTFEANNAVVGAGAYMRDGSTPRFTGCTFIHNLASVGGGLYLDFSRAVVESSFVIGNTAKDGGAIAATNTAEATFTYTSIAQNRTTQGATVACTESSPSFTNCTVASNRNDMQNGGTFGLRSSGTRIERCIVAFNAASALVCAGFSSPWVGCDDLYGNTSNVVCAGDQGTNLFVDPLFCDLQAANFALQADSPVLASTCGLLGAHSAACPGIGTAVVTTNWGTVKSLYRR